jgi:hypothetical protein
MYMIMSCHQNSGQSQNIRIANESFENVYDTNKKDIHDELKSSFNSGNACYNSVQNVLFSHLILKKY